MLNNKIKLKRYNYDDIKNLIIDIKNYYIVNIRYPLIITLNAKQYFLHSYIIVNNYKVDNKENNKINKILIKILIKMI